MKTLTILLIDDHKMVRDGIRSMLETQKNKYKFIIDEAEDGEEGVEKAKKCPHIIIMDYQLPKISGAEAAGMILRNEPKAKILALSNYNEYMYIDKMIKTGVKGFILKDIGPEELVKAIESVLNDKLYYSNAVATKLLTFDSSTLLNKKNDGWNTLKELLSEREIEVFKCIADGHTSEEIAQMLFISKRTVDTHRQSIMGKLGVKNMAGLVKYMASLIAFAKDTKS